MHKFPPHAKGSPSFGGKADPPPAEKNGFHLLKGKDKNKDQSYFLYTLSQKQLSKHYFLLVHILNRKLEKLPSKQNFPPQIK